MERVDEIATARKEREAEALYRIAEQFKKNGDDETAYQLRKEAMRIEVDDWAYDNLIEN